MKIIFILVFVMLLAGCSTTDETKIVGETPAQSKAGFAFQGSIYTIDRGKVLVEDVGKEIGKIEVISDKITKNGEATIFDSALNLKVGDRIYKIKEQDRSNAVVAIKIDNVYYGAIFNANLN